MLSLSLSSLQHWMKGWLPDDTTVQHHSPDYDCAGTRKTPEWRVTRRRGRDNKL